MVTRLALDQGTTVVLFGGCLTLGVLGAAKCLLVLTRDSTGGSTTRLDNTARYAGR